MSSAPERGTSPDQSATVSNTNPRAANFRIAYSAVEQFFARIPAGVRARVLALTGILCCIKAALIYKLSPHLFQVHWRVGGNELTWGGQAAFFLLIGLAVAHLWLLAGDCRRTGTKAVRVANASVLAIGLAFICLNFHSGEKNYLYPILSGVLGWSSLVPYLSLDFFFHQPYLAAWMFAYGLVYYFLMRAQREGLMLYVTAIFAAVYAGLYLHSLALYVNELCVIDALGLAGLVVAWKMKRVPLAAAALPVLFAFGFAGLLICRLAPATGLPQHYFFGLVAGAVTAFGVLTILLRRFAPGTRWGAQAAFFLSAFVLLTNHHYPVSSNYNQLAWLGLELPRYFLGELGIGFVLLLAAAVIGCFARRPPVFWLDVVALLLIALTLVDYRITGVMGVRFDWNVLALGNSPKMMWRMAQPYLPLVLGVLVLLGGIYGVVVWLVGRGLVRARTDGVPAKANSSLQYALATFVVLGLVGSRQALVDKARGQTTVRLIATSPWWKTITGGTPSPEKFFETAKSLSINFDDSQAQSNVQRRRDLNLVLVFMESTYNQHLSLFGAKEETQPLLSAYKDRMELFPNFFSNFASSIHARFAAFTSLYPVADYNLFTAEHVPVKSIFEVLHEQGYACSMFYSSFGDFTGFRDFLKGRGLDAFYDADTMPGQRKTERVSWGLQEEETLDAMRAQIQQYATDGRRFFLTYVPAAPHNPYDHVPERFRKFQPSGPGDFTAAYLNELLYMDWVLASLVEQLKRSGLLDKTLVVITDDHGEMLGGHGAPIGHGWLLTPQLVNAPLIILDPEKQGCRVNTTVGSQVDLLPTLCDRLGIPLPEGQLYEGRSLDQAVGSRREQRFGYLNSFQQYAVLDGNKLIFGDREKELRRGCPGTEYAISNEASTTVFKENGTVSVPIGIKNFDRFQEALLKNYAEYAKAYAAVRANKRANAGEVTRTE